jgi:hypothetical protein
MLIPVLIGLQSTIFSDLQITLRLFLKCYSGAPKKIIRLITCALEPVWGLGVVCPFSKAFKHLRNV